MPLQEAVDVLNCINNLVNLIAAAMQMHRHGWVQISRGTDP